MKFFVDTADVDEIADLASSGLLDGVTTNPSLVAQGGRNFLEVIREICAVVDGAEHEFLGKRPVGKPVLRAECRRSVARHRAIDRAKRATD